MAGSNRGGKIGLELFDARTGSEPARLKHLDDLRDFGLAYGGAEEGNLKRHSRRESRRKLARLTRVRVLAVVLEGKLAVVLAKETQETLVVAGVHVEEAQHDAIVASRLSEALVH